jgi:transposase
MPVLVTGIRVPTADGHRSVRLPIPPGAISQLASPLGSLLSPRYAEAEPVEDTRQMSRGRNRVTGYGSAPGVVNGFLVSESVRGSRQVRRRPKTGQSWWCVLPTVSVAAMNIALATFARDEGIGADSRAVLVVDQAGWHTGRDLVLPEGIDVVFLPPASPELQPAERLWVLVDEPVANRAFATLEHLEAVLVDRCRTLEADRDRIKAHTRFHWWPSEPRPMSRQ